MLPILLILRFGLDFFPAGEIKSIDTYYNRVYLLYEDGFVVLNRINKERMFSSSIDYGRMLIYDPEFGDLYIVTDNKILRYLEGSDHLSEIPLTGIKPTRAGIGKGYLYLETNSGYYRLRKGSFTIEKTSQVTATRWQEGLKTGEVTKYPMLTPYYFTDNLLNKYPITAISKLHRKLWVGSGLGLYLVDLTTARRKHITVGPLADVLKITDLDTVIAFISRDRISFYTPKEDSWYYRSYLHDIVDITTYGNHVYIGTKGGLFTVSSGVTLPILRNPIVSMSKIGNIIYLHAGSRVMALAPSSRLPIEIVTLAGRVNKIEVFRNQIFLGADRGLFLIDTVDIRREIIDPRGYFKFGVTDLLVAGDQLLAIANGHLVAYQDSFDYLPIDDGTSMSKDSDGIWIGTRTGVWSYKEGKVDRWYRLPAVEVYSLLEKNHYLWVATRDGLYRVRVE